MSSVQNEAKLGWVPRMVAGTASLIATIVWSHSLAALLRRLGPEDAPPAAEALTLAAVVVALVGIFAWPRGQRAALLAGAAGLVSAAFIDAIHPGAFAGALALAPVGGGVTLCGSWLMAHIPESAARWASRHRVLATMWAMVALIAVVQTGRLSTYMTDPEFDWYLTTRHPLWAKHECATAYFHAAELNQRGDANVYDAAHYPGLNPAAEPTTELEGLVVEDPYQYAPQFLLWPHLAIALTKDYATIRMIWFGVQLGLFGVAVLGLAAWIGGRTGKLAAYLSPVLLASFPMLHNLQFGQFHFAAVALCVLGLLAFEKKRPALGGALLAVSILSKLFPAVLLVPLVVQRRWRDLSWTAAAGAALSVVALAVLGPSPFAAFFEYHVPRLSDASAFAFGEAWPEIRGLIIADNQSVFGFVAKLAELGVPGMTTEVGIWANRLYGLALLGLAALVGLRLGRASRTEKAAAWLALLGLGSMASTAAFGDYVPVTCVWLLTILAAGVVGNARATMLLAACAIAQVFIVGTMPIGPWEAPELLIPLSIAGVVTMFAASAGTLLKLVAARDPDPIRHTSGERILLADRRLEFES